MSSSGNALSIPRIVAHIVRPAEGGLLTHVETLTAGMRDVRSLAAAPDAVLQRLSHIAAPDRFVLPSAPSSSRVLASGFRCGRWAQWQGVDLLHGHGLRWSPLFALASLFSRLPLVVTLHNLVPQRPSAITAAVMRLCLASAKRIIAVSEAIAATAATVLGAACSRKIRIVRNGIDLRPFQDLGTAADRFEARRQLRIPENAPVALCVARLAPEKNVSAFLDAAEQVAASGAAPGCRFLVAGDGPERGRLEARVHSSPVLRGCVSLLGMRADVPTILSVSDVVCIPSLEEGLGLAAIEAMAAGRPVVAMRVGGLPEVIVNQETGILIPRAALRCGLGDAISGLLSDPTLRERMGAAGRARAHLEFGSERMIAETRAVYEEALAD